MADYAYYAYYAYTTYRTAFHLACAGGHVQCVALLLGSGCDTSLRNEDGLTGWYATHCMSHIVRVRFQIIGNAASKM